jgi:hypothetical protein
MAYGVSGGLMKVAGWEKLPAMAIKIMTSEVLYKLLLGQSLFRPECVQ